ncbi:putative MO25-like protein At5g47540 isoform X3 [Sorghum bicolor]|nr:putative MO25-like protein At5g47540 isoform X1 [Sorghum bicolor]XP_021315901.1 putative MO25-like protein At5g47540 isoform X1 [Sorghum bicolor]XP_021315902.1 putative MO25-like protein At5g47540 isoform X1 [Sorghum bicolor]XP_021315903.1 putative MO25-like protein At5g47540 isoform X1 [Sorghum bicolor]XP_021315904.1 putative MO25-like protein At5g47540 isoform X1 [Sorghum bicolor]XP_021315905.1 putative MO25-like protein At5g47540 isoform X1 [Sorghum bicolor]XP_021315907.1 putative MO25-|eukprot:XP_021315900.1 putative MO25-like protein At5g47540 isoform X1 [Sorghum bicolor]
MTVISLLIMTYFRSWTTHVRRQRRRSRRRAESLARGRPARRARSSIGQTGGCWSIEMTGCLWPCVGAAVAGDGADHRGLFRSKPRTPVEVVQHVRDLVTYVLNNKDGCAGGRRDAKLEHRMLELSKGIKEMKGILYGNGEDDPCEEACKQLTKEFFKKNTDTFRQFIVCLQYVNLDTQKDVTQVIANLQRQKVDSRLVASDYLEANLDLLEILMSGYENLDIAIHYSTLLRDCIRHQVAARYVLESPHFRTFFDHIQFPDFNIQSDVFKTFKELMTRHKSTVAEFFSKNYDWFFAEFNSKLILSASNYFIRRQAVQLLRDILLERSNSAVMMCYVSSKEHLMIHMNLLRDDSIAIQVEAFHVFKLFVANKEQPPEITSILRTNRSKLLRFLKDFTAVEKDDKKFEADKATVISEILALAGAEN